MNNQIVQLIDYYDSALIYHPNIFFVVAPILIVLIGFWVYMRIGDAVRFWKVVTRKSPKQYLRYRKFLKQAVVVRTFYFRTVKKIQKIQKAVAHEILLPENKV